MIDMKLYENVKIFVLDFGGVLYEINHKATFKAFLSLSKYPEKFIDYDLKKYLNDELIVQFEKGLIGDNQFRNKVREKFFIDADDDTFDKAFNATLVKIKDDAINCVKKLKQCGNVVLLSNTNEIHYKYFNKECEELFNLFDELYFSHLIGSRKPESEIFQILLNKTGFASYETLFVDDSIENISTAKDLGFETYIIDEVNSLSDLAHNV